MCFTKDNWYNHRQMHKHISLRFNSSHHVSIYSLLSSTTRPDGLNDISDGWHSGENILTEQINEGDVMKQYRYSFFALFCLLVLFAACGSAPPATTTTGTTSQEQTVKIPIGDFYVHSPQTTFLTGVQYHFVVTNEGKHHHDFLIMHPMLTETMIMDQVYQNSLSYIYNIAPGETKTLDFTFDHTAPAGMLDFDCHYGGHFEAGMHQDIVVKAQSGASVTPLPQ